MEVWRENEVKQKCACSLRLALPFPHHSIQRLPRAADVGVEFCEAVGEVCVVELAALEWAERWQGKQWWWCAGLALVGEVVFALAIRTALSDEPDLFTWHVLSPHVADALRRSIGDPHPHGGKPGGKASFADTADGLTADLIAPR